MAWTATPLPSRPLLPRIPFPSWRNRRAARRWRCPCCRPSCPPLLLLSPKASRFRPQRPLFSARTGYAGAFLLLPQALTWLAVARDCFQDELGTLARGLLTSVFALSVGLERLWHLEEMEDVGFALLTGGGRCPSRYTVGGWRRHLAWYEVDAFCRRTSPWDYIQGDLALLSYDEHTIPRWTSKFHINKGYVTTRNKHMRCEKLFYTYDLLHHRYLAVRATPGNWGLNELAVPLLRQSLRLGRPDYLHALFDAGAGHADADVRALWDLVEQEHPRLDVTLRACRRTHWMRNWKALPSGLFVPYQEAGPYVGAPPKEVRVAQTSTVLKGETAEQAIETIICREIVPGPKKDRWHPLFTTALLEPYENVTLFRLRQRHEQGYRVGVHDEFLNAVPCGYDKNSANPKRPRFHRGPLQMLGWLVALVYNACGDLAEALAGDWEDCHIRTLRRRFLNRPGQLYATPEALLVQLDPFQGQQALLPVIDAFNAASHRLPWLENRRLVLCLTPEGRTQAGP